jgi:hypothetical protein
MFFFGAKSIKYQFVAWYDDGGVWYILGLEVSPKGCSRAHTLIILERMVQEP